MIIPPGANTLRSFSPDEMMREVHAQFERFVAVANRLPTHLDSHYHATYFHPAAVEATRSLCPEAPSAPASRPGGGSVYS